MADKFACMHCGFVFEDPDMEICPRCGTDLGQEWDPAELRSFVVTELTDEQAKFVATRPADSTAEEILAAIRSDGCFALENLTPRQVEAYAEFLKQEGIPFVAETEEQKAVRLQKQLEAHAASRNAEAEKWKAQAAAEAKSQAEAEARSANAHVQAEVEAKLRAEAEAQTAEAKAKADAEQAKIKAAELEKARLETEARKAEAEAQKAARRARKREIKKKPPVQQPASKTSKEQDEGCVWGCFVIASLFIVIFSGGLFWAEIIFVPIFFISAFQLLKWWIRKKKKEKRK